MTVEQVIEHLVDTGKTLAELRDETESSWKCVAHLDREGDADDELMDEYDETLMSIGTLLQ